MLTEYVRGKEVTGRVGLLPAGLSIPLAPTRALLNVPKSQKCQVVDILWPIFRGNYGEALLRILMKKLRHQPKVVFGVGVTIANKKCVPISDQIAIIHIEAHLKHINITQ